MEAQTEEKLIDGFARLMKVVKELKARQNDLERQIMKLEAKLEVLMQTQIEQFKQQAQVQAVHVT